MDIYERIHSEIVSSNRFDKNSDISTTYLGKIENRENTNQKQRNHFLYQKMATP